ncbi:MAG: nitrilase-related carbon-nitrogen hydrolase [bacterium]
MDKLRIASIQINSEPSQVTKNNEKTVAFLHKAKKEGVQLAVLPELFNVGYNLPLLKDLDYDCDEAVELYGELAKSLDMYIAAGLLEVDEKGKYNSVFVFNNKGEIESKYRKVNLFPLSIEEEIFTAGQKLAVFTVGSFKFGVMICYDIRFPELGRLYVEKKCNALIVASAFPFPRLDHWRTLLKSRAIENQLYLIASNRTGKDKDFWFVGNSCVIDPWGTVKVTMSETDEGIICHDLAIEKVNEVRKFIPALKNKQNLDSLISRKILTV